MTKFERAKAQTLDMWESSLDNLCGYPPFKGNCGFCVEYDKEFGGCINCPIFWANDKMGCIDIEYAAGIDPLFAEDRAQRIWDILAILTYIHSLTEEGCIRPETK